jgi:hypothetical protein
MALVAQVLQAIASGIERVESELNAEQAVRGLDMLDELRLHALIAGALETSAWGVLREVPYPTPPSRRARRSERDRCDLVLTPRSGQRIRDAVEIARLEDARAATLFALVASPSDENGGSIDPNEAIWIELKTTGQFTCRDGVGGPNHSYASDLVRGPSTDIRKLAADPAIQHGIAVLVMFTPSERIARHDLTAAAHRMLDCGVPLLTYEFVSIPILDRIGNRVCVVAGFGARPATSD